ncbi:hypothetical protein [Rhodococcus wratislaviensis]|uniref:hypothetical protein n=1 Tax=Rhodococcus wratislaviensis TaxID=44752 RepID=UPI000F55E34A|nr:hypothetical protein [Rhodococcus wratislaviensis]
MPTVVVQPQVAIPSELLDGLVSSNPHWWAQPVATVLAALIALAAARIAWRGVQAQIKTQRDLHAESHQAELRKQERADRVEAVLESVKMLQEAQIKLTELGLLRSRSAPTEELNKCGDEMLFLLGRVDVSQFRLDLVGAAAAKRVFIDVYEDLSNAYHLAMDTDSELDAVTAKVRRASDAVFFSRPVFIEELRSASADTSSR